MARGAKAKGSSAERELLDILWENGFAVIRAAGSGSTQHDACDLIAGKDGRSLAIEVKACVANTQYISREQMKELLDFSRAFGAKPFIAVKWTRRGWSIMEATTLSTEGKLFSIKQSQMTPLKDWIATQTIGFEVH